MSSPESAKVVHGAGEDLWWKDLLKRSVLSLEWKRVGVMDGESGDDRTGESR